MVKLSKLKPLVSMIYKRNKFYLFIIIFLAILTQIAALSLDLFIAKTIEYFYDYSNSNDINLLNNQMLTLFLTLFLVLVISSFSWYFEPRYYGKVVSDVEPYLRLKLLNKMLYSDTKNILNKKSGEIVNKINRGAISSRNIIMLWRWDIAPFLVGIPLIFILLSRVNFYFLVLNILFILALTPVTINFTKKNSQQWKKAYVKFDKQTGILNDLITNVLPIKVNVQEKYSEKMYKKSIDFIPGFFDKITKLFARWGRDTNVIVLIFFGLNLFLGMHLFVNNIITIDQFSLAILLFNRTDKYIDKISNTYRSIYDLAAQFDSAYKLLDEKNTILDDKDAERLKVTKGKIEFNDVTFSYENKKVFDKFKFLINPGETVGVVGKSGAGKTTLVNILLRLYELDEGYISIDGQNIRHVTQQSLRNSTSLVPQDTLLFDDTIYNNILFANPNSNRREVLSALKKAELFEFINSLPNKEKTIVGERGVKLSGGQRQRISIARAILANKKIIVLDEATSALDSETELKIRDTLDRITKGRTTITIAHRLSTVMNSDKIVVFDDGKIVEVGDHKSLLKKKGKYAELWKYQTKGYL